MWPVVHAVDRILDTRLWKHYLAATSLRAVIKIHSISVAQLVSLFLSWTTTNNSILLSLFLRYSTRRPTGFSLNVEQLMGSGFPTLYSLNEQDLGLDYWWNQTQNYSKVWQKQKEMLIPSIVAWAQHRVLNRSASKMVDLLSGIGDKMDLHIPNGWKTSPIQNTKRSLPNALPYTLSYWLLGKRKWTTFLWMLKDLNWRFYKRFHLTRLGLK